MLDIVGMDVEVTFNFPDEKDTKKTKSVIFVSTVYGISRETVDSKPITQFLVANEDGAFMWVNMAHCIIKE